MSSLEWHTLFESYGWLTCPLLFPACEPLVTDNPAASAGDPDATRSFSVGMPHPQYGIMRATAFLTSATSLTRLVSIVHPVATQECASNVGMPHLYLGTRPFVDRVGSRECIVIGGLVFSAPHEDGHLRRRVQYSPVTLARWQRMWLPYFEDDNDWVMTGWDVSGRVTEMFKPFGWGCHLLAPATADTESCASCSPADRTIDEP